MYRKTIFRIYFSLLAFLLAACAGTNDWQPSEAALAGDPVAMWQDGQEAINRGQQQISRGEDIIKEGQAEVRDGQSLVSEGNSLINRSREQYRVAARTSGSALTPEQLEAEANRLRRIAGDWEEGLDLVERGNRRIRNGNERISEGQGVVLQGQTLIDSGQNMLRNSEMMRQDA